ncbi:ABC transporter substrate-binding protein [Thiomicrospira microaerophila]|uniref:ABC transporter substrate-binding protein n=1 Tax=Thiomicrospira microaerophila TaxID=406020 RepID=UPI000697A9CF|nr:ABC transporter substrate-binding protein [Thiomicrospira microaerophila]
MSAQMHTPLPRRRFLQAGLCTIAAPWWLSGCERKIPLALAGHIWPGYEFIHLATQFNWLNNPGLHLVHTPSATESMDALRQGKVQAAKLTLDEVIRLCAEGLELEVVLIFNISMGADVVLSRPEITQLYQLEGKRVGFEKTALGSLLFHAMLKRAQLTTEQVTPVNLTIDDHNQAWLADDIDALITYEPVATQIVNQGKAFRLFDSRQIPDMIFDVLVVKKSLKPAQQSALKDLIAQHFNALRYFNSNPMDASHRMADRLALTPEQVLQIFRGLFIPDELANTAYLSGHDNRLAHSAHTLLQVMKVAKLLDAECDLEGLFTNRFLPRVQQ